MFCVKFTTCVLLYLHLEIAIKFEYAVFYLGIRAGNAVPAQFNSWCSQPRAAMIALHQSACLLL